MGQRVGDGHEQIWAEGVRNSEVMELAVAMCESQDELGRLLIAGDADHDAVDRALALDLDPTVLATSDVATVGTFGDDALNGCEDRQPLLSDLSIVSLDHQLQARMQPVDQALELSSGTQLQ
jgi:hypothetical protein